KSKRKSSQDNPVGYKLTLRDLTRQIPTLDDLLEIEREINSFSDQNAAIVLASVVDRYLELAIVEKLERNDDETRAQLTATGGALDGFFAKINLGYAMGLFNVKRRNDLESIRRIRNCFAHSPKVITFDTPQINKECSAIALGRSLRPNYSNRDRYVYACNRITKILISGVALKMIKAIREKFAKIGGKYSEYVDEIDQQMNTLEDHYKLMTDTVSNNERSP
ncbi:MAG: hypothetical protein P4M13_02550, partial [Alphaproteobacteria bacterium]|nr:hypothetical protein [Alphaproteobacteria bacterium]